MNKITDKVYLGDCFGAENENAIKAEGITHVLSCMGDLSPKYQDKSIIQKIIKLDDSEITNIFQYFSSAIKFMDEAKKVFVHCFAGVSRSATLVIAYFMWKNKISYKESLELVYKHRNIGPNVGFRKQLVIFGEKLKNADYDLDKINWKDFTWPPKETLNLSYSDLY